MKTQNIILKILTTKNNTFITFLDMNHILLYKQSVGTKITQDFKAALLATLTAGLSQIKNTILINDLNNNMNTDKTEEAVLNINTDFNVDLNTNKDFTADLITDQESDLNTNFVSTTNINKKEESTSTINLYLYLKNFPKIYIADILNLFIVWQINICYFSFNLNIPHNGCRYPHKSRKKKKKQHLQVLDCSELEEVTSNDSTDTDFFV